MHCNAHCLNLVLVDTVKTVPDAHCFFSLLQKLYVFISGSYVHQKWLDVQKQMYEGPPREMQRLSDTRWACRYLACKTVKDRLPAIIKVLEEISQESNGERAVEARGLLAQIDLKFVGLLVIFTQVFGDAKHLSDVLQSPQLNLSTAVALVDSLIETFNDYRQRSHFEQIWDNSMNLAQQCNISPLTPKREVKVSSRLDGHYVTSPIVKRQMEMDKDTFHKSTFIPVLDVLLCELKRRFSKDNCDTDWNTHCQKKGYGWGPFVNT